jgi:hypothetical protein
MTCQNCNKEYDLDFFGMNQILCDECERQKWREENVSEKHKTIGDLLRSLNVEEDFIKEFEGETYDQLLQWCADLYQAGELMYDELSEREFEEYGLGESSPAVTAWEEARKLKDIHNTETDNAKD